MEERIVRTYGSVFLEGQGGIFTIKAEPHVRMRLKRMIRGCKVRGDLIQLDNTLANCEDLEWFFSRYPMSGERDALALITSRSKDQEKRRVECERIIHGTSRTPSATKLPLRDYQNQAVDLLISQGRLLVGDDLGLGKTAIAFGAVAKGEAPAVIVCQTHLQTQWKREAEKFLGDQIRCHIVKKGSFYKVPEHDILIIPYSKLAGWGDFLQGYNLICFDEAQELRRSGSNKYLGAVAAAMNIRTRLHLTATPIYNYGDEIYNVLNCIAPGELGSYGEFNSEWCTPIGVGKYKVRDPKALGMFLRDQYLMLRRRRIDVGRELPAVTVIRESVGFDAKRLKDAEDSSVQLAHAVLEGSFTERGQAARELDWKMRQQTGIAKAPYVADFIADMVGAGEKVLLGGWHREFYSVVQAELRSRGIESVMYTGSESPVQKDKARLRFSGEEDPEAQVMMMSLRSGAGIDGLQKICSVVVFGELDWSPKVHDQFIGRLNRDGQDTPVTVVYLVADGGSDPVVAATLGIKKEQSDGVVDPDLEFDSVLESTTVTNNAAEMAKRILRIT